jgi:hypothetical protein
MTIFPYKDAVRKSMRNAAAGMPIEPAHKSKSPGSGLKKNRPETGGVVD